MTFCRKLPDASVTISRVRLPPTIFKPHEGEGRRDLTAHNTVAAVGRGTRVPDSDKARPRKEGLGVEEGGGSGSALTRWVRQRKVRQKKKTLIADADGRCVHAPGFSMAQAIYKTRCDALHAAAKRCI